MKFEFDNWEFFSEYISTKFKEDKISEPRCGSLFLFNIRFSFSRVLKPLFSKYRQGRPRARVPW